MAHEEQFFNNYFLLLGPGRHYVLYKFGECVLGLWPCAVFLVINSLDSSE